MPSLLQPATLADSASPLPQIHGLSVKSPVRHSDAGGRLSTSSSNASSYRNSMAGSSASANAYVDGVYVGDVLRVSRESENIGERVAMSKKRVTWRFVFVGTQQVHTLMLEHSRVSGKKRLRLDGRKLFQSDQYTTGNWKYEFRVPDHDQTAFCLTIKDVKTNVRDPRKSVYDLLVNGLPWKQLADRALPASSTAFRQQGNRASSVWSSELYARRVSDDQHVLNKDDTASAAVSEVEPGIVASWTVAFGVHGSIHKMEVRDLEVGAFVVIFDSRELARVDHDDIQDDVWEYEYTFLDQHLLCITVTLVDEDKTYELFIDGCPWKDIGETEFVLQPGWFPVYSRTRGDVYFRNEKLNKSQWEKPVMPRGAEIASVEEELAESFSSASGVMPDNDPNKAPELVLDTKVEQEEVNLLDFSEISVHSSPKAKPASVGFDSAFDPFDPFYQASLQAAGSTTYDPFSQAHQAPVDPFDPFYQASHQQQQQQQQPAAMAIQPQPMQQPKRQQEPLLDFLS